MALTREEAEAGVHRLPCKPRRGTRDGGGYCGVWSLGGARRRRRWKLHRWAWRVAHGPIPVGMHILHACDTKICFQEAHLYPGTDRDNAADRVRRASQSRYERAGYAYLTHDVVSAIREALAAGVKQQRIAEIVGCVQAHVSRIARGVVWAPLPGAQPDYTYLPHLPLRG